MNRTWLSLALGVALLSVACSNGGDPSSMPARSQPASTESPSPTVAPGTSVALSATCEHPQGIVVSYPEGWSANQGDSLPRCSAFDPAAPQIQEGREFFDAAVLLSVEKVEFAAVVEPEALSGEVIDRTETMVDGHDAVRVETRSEGNALLPEGVRSTRWFVVFGRERTLSLVAHEVGAEDDYEAERRVLDEMVPRLQLPADG